MMLFTVLCFSPDVFTKTGFLLRGTTALKYLPRYHLYFFFTLWVLLRVSLRRKLIRANKGESSSAVTSNTGQTFYALLFILFFLFFFNNSFLFFFESIEDDTSSIPIWVTGVLMWVSAGYGQAEYSLKTI